MFIFHVNDFVRPLSHVYMFFKQRFRACVDNKWNIHVFMILIKLKYLVACPGHVITEFFFATETELDIQYKKLYMQAASQVAELPKT